jgi:hypothetical protein
VEPLVPTGFERRLERGALQLEEVDGTGHG